MVGGGTALKEISDSFEGSFLLVFNHRHCSLPSTAEAIKKRERESMSKKCVAHMCGRHCLGNVCSDLL